MSFPEEILGRKFQHPCTQWARHHPVNLEYCCSWKWRPLLSTSCATLRYAHIHSVAGCKGSSLWGIGEKSVAELPLPPTWVNITDTEQSWAYILCGNSKNGWEISHPAAKATLLDERKSCKK